MPAARMRQSRRQVSDSALARIPMVGDMVHFYENDSVGTQPNGLFPAIVTSATEWPHDPLRAVNLAVFYDGSCGWGLRGYPSVPYNDGGMEVGQWWAWPPRQDPEAPPWKRVQRPR